MKLAIEVNKVYRPLWQTKKRYVVVMGGRGAGRSYETSQNIIAKLTQSARFYRAAIMRAVHADIRHSIWQELVDRVETRNIESAYRIVDTTMEMEHCKNSVHAHGFRKSSSDRTAKLKSLAGYTDAIIEEAEEIGEDEFNQLDDSLRAEGSQIYLLLNTPSKNHWIIKRWFVVTPCPDASGFYTVSLKPGVEDVEFITSYHADNPYLSESVHQRYESYRLLKPAYYWQMIRGYSPEVIMGRSIRWREIAEVPHEARLLSYAWTLALIPIQRQWWPSTITMAAIGVLPVNVAIGIEHRILDAIQGRRPRNAAKGYGEVTIKTQAAAIAMAASLSGHKAIHVVTTRLSKSAHDPGRYLPFSGGALVCNRQFANRSISQSQTGLRT
jgi:hypothetical protein